MANLAQNYQQAYNDVKGNRASSDHTVDAYQTFDAQVTYAGLKATRFTLGMKNLFDRNPPYANYAASTGQFVGGYDISYSDVRGRFLYATATHTF